MRSLNDSAACSRRRRGAGFLSAIAAAALPLFGCGPGPLGPDFALELTSMGGCADVLLYAVDPDDEVMLEFWAEGLVEGAREVGEETVTVFDLPSERVDLNIEQGDRVSDVTCDDVAENGGPNVRRTWTATSGTATLTVRPEEESGGARADLVLENVLFGSEGDTVTLERMEWADVPVGWFPG